MLKIFFIFLISCINALQGDDVIFVKKKQLVKATQAITKLQKEVNPEAENYIEVNSDRDGFIVKKSGEYEILTSCQIRVIAYSPQAYEIQTFYIQDLECKSFQVEVARFSRIHAGFFGSSHEIHRVNLYEGQVWFIRNFSFFNSPIQLVQNPVHPIPMKMTFKFIKEL